MGKLEKSFYWLCLVLAIYITIGFKIIPMVVKDQLIKNLDENLTQKTSIEKVEFNPFILEAKVHGFKIADENNITTIAFKQFAINFALLKSIQKASVSFDNITLKDAFINVIEEKDGNINLAKLAKPSQEVEEKKEEESSSNLTFLVSKLELLNANISYTKQDEDYTLNLKDINYTLYDLGTYQNILSSNDLKFKLNEHTNISIGGAFKLEPFRGYGKILIEDLRLKELLTYKKDLLNFDLDENANLNLQLNYDFHANKDFALNISSDKFEFNNVNLKQNEADILNLEKLDIKTFVFNLDRQNIKLDNIDFKALKTNMILDKNGINFANLTKQETPAVQTTTQVETNTQVAAKTETKVEAEPEAVVKAQNETPTTQVNKDESKPWKISLSNLKINNSDFTFSDKVNNTIAQTKAFNITLNSLKVDGSNIDLNSLNFTNPNLSFSDNKNKMDISAKNAKINLDTLTLKEGALNINKIAISKDNLTLNDKKSNISLLSKKTDVSINALKVANNKTSIDSITVKTPNLNFDDIKSKMKIQTSNIDINVKTLLIDGKKTSISSIGLKTPKIDFDDNKSQMNVQTSNINLDVNSLVINGAKTSINSISLKTPKLDFDDSKAKMKVETSNIDLDVNSLLIDGKKTSINSIELKTPKIDFDDNKAKMEVKTSNINLKLNTFVMNDSDISLKDIKLIKPSVNFVDKTNNMKIDAKDIELSINNLTKVKDTIAINHIKLLEPELNFLDTSSNTLIEAKNLDLIIKKLSNNKSGFKIEKTDLNEPSIAITLPKAKEAKKETVVQNTQNNTKEEPAPASKIDIGPININNAVFTFEDKNLPIPFKTTVTKLNGKISEFKNTKSGTTDLKVDGIVDKYGVAKITGIVHPNNIKVLTDINMIFNNIAISNFTPYSGKFIGREIKSGKLNLDLKYNIQKSNLDAKNNISITKIELGKNVQSPDAVSLPLDIAITLLQNSQGVIDINLPVSGNVDDPKFSIASIVWNAFTNLMTKAVTAPFSLLGALFNFSEDEIKNVKFDLAEDKITPIQKETLDKIAQILIVKQDLAIKISASYDSQKEEYALKEKKYLDKNPNDRNLKKEELQKLASKEKVSVSDLEDIAKNRIENIKDYLIKDKSINSKQIILTDKIKTSSSSIDLGIDKIK
jgi:hypothetical protein